MNPISSAADQPARILIVDDELHNRQLLEFMLSPEGFVLQTASSGEEALAILARQPPDLILLDVLMPAMDGYQVATRIKGNAATKSIPVIMITALDDRNARMLGLSAGAEDFLTAPVDPAELRVRVRNLLRLKAYGDYHDKYSKMLEGEVSSRTADLVLANEALRTAEERTRFALEAADVGVWDHDHRTGAVRWSATLEAHYGLQPGTFGGTYEAFLAVIHPDDRASLLETIGKAMKTGADFAVEHRSIRPDGTTRWMRCAGQIYLDGDGKPARGVGISQDITERRTLEAQQQQGQKMEAIGRLASGVAHDFNNLLTVILGFAELVSADVAMANEHREELGEITKAAQRATTLTKQLLAFSRQQVLNAAPVDLNRLITDMTGMLRRLIGADIEVALNLAPDLSPALADRGQLEQVVMNLVVNARDAMTGGGSMTIETKDAELEPSSFHELAVTPGQYVMLAITDTGSGMTKETQRRIFEPFFTTKETGKGTGLGLSTTYGIVKQSKGYIWVYSEPGLGTTFKVYLPRSNGAVPSQALSPATVSPVQRPSETVLLVEDETGVRQLSKRILENAGYHVLEAVNGEDAERVFERHADRINLVVTDVIMPGFGGPELIRRLQVQTPSLRVLYMSGYTQQSAVIQAGLDRGLPFVQKPFKASEFVRQVRVALDR